MSDCGVIPVGSGAEVKRRVLQARPIFLAFLGALVSFCSAGCFSTVSPEEAGDGASPDREAARCISPEEAERMAEQVLELVNLERAQRDLQPVVASNELSKVAEDYACRMITEGFFGHRDPATGDGPSQRAISAKYTFFAIGENLAAGPRTSAEVMKVWMDSPSHRAIILDPTWRDLGIAVRTGGEYAIYWVQEFGDPAQF